MENIIWKLKENEFGSILICTNAEGNRYWVPINEGNTDYQAYLEWVAEGNTAEVVEPSA